MKITKERQQIIELIEPYMDKTLSEGCLIKSASWKYETMISKKYFFMEIAHIKTHVWLNWQEQIIGHYDISSVLKYIDSRNEDVVLANKCCEFLITWIWRFPNKPLILYTEQEDKDLLELLKKLCDTKNSISV